MEKLAITRDIAERKNAALVGVLGLLPGASELYLGGPFVKFGLMRLASFVLGWFLILGIIGIFIVPFVWLMSILNAITAALRVRRLQRELEVERALPSGDR